MSGSIIYSALIAAILAQSLCPSMDFLALNIEVIDLTGQADGPLAPPMEVEVGGDTDIAEAFYLVRSRLCVSVRTLLILVSDFDEGGSLDVPLDETGTLAISGMTMLDCAALNDPGTGVHNVGVASRVAAMGIRVTAVSPLDLVHWVGIVIREHS